MAEETLTIASAVVVPEPETSEAPLPPAASPLENGSLKRRQSSAPEDATAKRPRLSAENLDDEASSSHAADAQPQPQSAADKIAARRANRALEERKRGQRLFGGLLSTLSQSASSTTQRRRADIDRKQQAKLKQREEEFDQKQRERYEVLMKIRRREQWKWEEEGMRVRHEGLRVQAGFLKTRTEPVLFYKPWELRPEEEDEIRGQIEDVEATIDREVDEFERRREEAATTEGNNPSHDGQPHVEDSTNGHDVQDINQSNASQDKPVPENTELEEEQRGGANPQSEEHPNPNNTDANPVSQLDERASGENLDQDVAMNIDTNGMTSAEADADAAHKLRRGSIDDNGEVILEGEEDTVIY